MTETTYSSVFPVSHMFFIMIGITDIENIDDLHTPRFVMYLSKKSVKRLRGLLDLLFHEGRSKPETDSTEFLCRYFVLPCRREPFQLRSSSS